MSDNLTQLYDIQALMRALAHQVSIIQHEIDSLLPPPSSAKPTVAPTPATTTLAILREVVARNNYVILDTETTGLNDGEIVQIAIIDSTGKTLLDTLVKPTRGIPMDATRIHGISAQSVATAPTWVTVATIVKQLLTGKDVIVYNATYDRKMLHKSTEYAGMEKIDWKTIAPWYCAMEAYAEFFGDWNDYRQSYRWQKLVDAARNCGVVVENAHDAVGDCLMTLGVIKHMMGAQK